jgi:hypothetical protein
MKIACLADSHCGSVGGLTPPWREAGGQESHLARMRASLWAHFVEHMPHQPDVLLLMGDLVDGAQRKDDARGLLMPDCKEQLSCVEEIIDFIHPTHTVLVYGTGYHVIQGIHLEQELVERLKHLPYAPIDAGHHVHVRLGGMLFDLKHTVGTGMLYHTRSMPLLRENYYNLLRADCGMSPRARVFLRAHAHRYMWHSSRHVDMGILPSLQAWSDFGARLSDTHDVGVVHLDVTRGSLTHQVHLMDFKYLSKQTQQIDDTTPQEPARA